MNKEFKDSAVLEVLDSSGEFLDKPDENLSTSLEIENPRKRVVEIREILNSDGSTTITSEVYVGANGINSGWKNVVGTPEEIKNSLGGNWLGVYVYQDFLDKKPQSYKTFINGTKISSIVQNGGEIESAKSQITVSIPTINKNSSYTQKKVYEVDLSVDEIESFLDGSSIKKVLFLTANPKETSRLRLDKEIRAVKNGFDSATERDNFEFISEPAVTISDITKAIQKIKPHIVHFSGHGEGKEGLVVEGKNGEIVCFETQSLSRLFNLIKEEVECVVLNACYSQEQALAISSIGVGTNDGIYAIGTNDSIEDQAAIDFSKGFYQSIGEGNDYEFAFQIGLVHVNDIDAVNKPEIWFNGENITENNNLNQSTSHNEIRKSTKNENKYKSETTDINSPIEKEAKPKNIFICYTGEDSSYKEKFESSLANLKRANKVKIWSDQEILAGEKPDETIEMHLKEADIIVLLLSPDFLDSDKIWDKEFPVIEKHLKNKTAKVIPILLRSCDWKETKIGKLKTIPTNPKNHELEPISKWEDKDEAWQIVLNEIKKII